MKTTAQYAQEFPVTIPISTATSPEVDLQGTNLIAVRLPTTMSGVSFTVEGRNLLENSWSPLTALGGTIIPVAYSASTTLPRTYPFPYPILAAGYRFYRIVTNTNQTAARNIVLIGRSFA